MGGERGSPQNSNLSPQNSNLCPISPSVRPTDIRTTGGPLLCFRPPNIALHRSPSTAGTRGAPRSPGSYREKNSNQKIGERRSLGLLCHVTYIVSCPLQGTVCADEIHLPDTGAAAAVPGCQILCALLVLDRNSLSRHSYHVLYQLQNFSKAT